MYVCMYMYVYVYVCMNVYDTLFVWLSEYRLLFIEVASEEYQITSFFGLRNQDLPQVFTMMGCMYVLYVCMCCSCV